jgi:hypothetical protein
MNINADKMTSLHRGLHALGLLGIYVTASLPNDNHGRPDFFYLQTKLPGNFGWCASKTRKETVRARQSSQNPHDNATPPSS